ncbi:hypothetical protein FQR65_LT10710 [Abscondita terminalis]|nr:hypothetical protein FQR65_LT10710 [Abscondita terminalis]
MSVKDINNGNVEPEVKLNSLHRLISLDKKTCSDKLQAENNAMISVTSDSNNPTRAEVVQGSAERAEAAESHSIDLDILPVLAQKRRLLAVEEKVRPDESGSSSDRELGSNSSDNCGYGDNPHLDRPTGSRK